MGAAIFVTRLTSHPGPLVPFLPSALCPFTSTRPIGWLHAVTARLHLKSCQITTTSFSMRTPAPSCRPSIEERAPGTRLEEFVLMHRARVAMRAGARAPCAARFFLLER